MEVSANAIVAHAPDIVHEKRQHRFVRELTFDIGWALEERKKGEVRENFSNSEL